MQTAKRINDAEMNASRNTLLVVDCEQKMTLAAIFNTMRILKKVNPGDTYYEQYQGMLAKYGETFFDTYQLLWGIGVYLAPKRILEIGMRTGISMCQLLSAHSDLAGIEKIVGVDPFDDFTSPNLIRANLRYLNIKVDEKLEIRPVTSDKFFSELDHEPHFDYILVDGDHSKEAARRDLEHAHIQLEQGGIIVFDDISTAPGECALIDVWEAWKADHKDEYVFTEIMEGKGVALAIKI